MFSVVIPLYNKELSIRNTLQSVLDQTFTNFEIVIVNDGSTDSSATIVEEFTDPRIRLIHQENQGVSAARNHGIQEATNEWVTFLDADDLWMRNHLEEYKKVIDEHPQMNWIISGYLAENKRGNKKFIYQKNGILENVIDDLLNGLKIHTSTVCIRKKLFEENNDLYFRIGMNNSEDREVWYKLCILDKNPYYIKMILSIYYTEIIGSLTQIHSTRNDNFLSMKERLLEFYNIATIDSTNKEKLLDYIDRYNRRTIYNHYIISNNMNPRYKVILSKMQWWFLSSTIMLPSLFKRLVIKIFF